MTAQKIALLIAGAGQMIAAGAAWWSLRRQAKRWAEWERFIAELNARPKGDGK